MRFGRLSLEQASLVVKSRQVHTNHFQKGNDQHQHMSISNSNIHAKYKNLQIFTEAYQGYILEMGKQKAIRTSARNSYPPSISFNNFQHH
jgi:hypothetical protein